MVKIFAKLSVIFESIFALLSLLEKYKMPLHMNKKKPKQNIRAMKQNTSKQATLGDRSFNCAAPKLWNELSFEIRSASTVSCFKAKLNSHFFLGTFLT